MSKIITLLIAASVLLAISSGALAEKPLEKPRMNKTDVVALANIEAKRQGFDLSKYEAPRAKYQFVHKNQTWTVFYEGKEKDPGNHFSVWVDDRTGKCHLMSGK